MYYFLTASKDTSVYLQQPNQNTGLDEVLEVSKVYYGNIKDISRSLIQFDITHLSDVINSGKVVMETATLVMWETESEEIPLQYSIRVHPIAESWEMGIGTRFDDISTAGATWRYREGDSKLDWGGVFDPIYLQDENGNFLVDDDGNYIVESFFSDNFSLGGSWYESIFTEQFFTYKTHDLNVDVKPIIDLWLNTTLENNGFIVKYPSEFEQNTEDYGILKFFSKETHTIYQPKLRIAWDDQVFSTGSLQPITTSELKIGIRGLKKEYKVNKRTRLEIFGRELYPLKVFSKTFPYSDRQYLPQTSFYQIRDLASNDVIIPFSNFSKISCDGISNFITLDFTNWEAGRTYKLEFKVVFGDDEYFFDNDDIFDIIV
jgi:hypothetical protein